MDGDGEMATADLSYSRQLDSWRGARIIPEPRWSQNSMSKSLDLKERVHGEGLRVCDRGIVLLFLSRIVSRPEI